MVPEKRNSTVTKSNSGLAEDPSELDLYLMQPGVKCSQLAFKRLLPNEYPLRQVVGNGRSHNLAFVNMHDIENYLFMMGSLKA